MTSIPLPGTVDPPSEPIAAPRPARSSGALIAGAAIVAGATLAFFLLWWNRFSALRDGNGSILAARAIAAGKLPYRDWYCPAPPLHILKSLLVLRIFGDHLIVLREFAVFERVILALVAYFWLARSIRRSHAALAAIVGIVVSAGDIADPLVSYNHDTILWGVLSGFCASFAIDRSVGHPARAAALLSGLFAGLCLCTKQTIGLGIAFGVPTVVAAYLLRSEGFTKTLRFLSCFALGLAVPLSALCLWLYREGAFWLFLDSIFLRGPSGKGFGSMLTRVVFANRSSATIFATLGTAWCVRTLARESSKSDTREDGRRRFFWVALIAGLAFAGAAFASRGGLLPFTGFQVFTIDLALFTSGILASFYAMVWLRRRITGDEAQLWLWSTVSFVVAFMLFLSWPRFEAMVMPGLPFLLGLALEKTSGLRRASIWCLSGILLLTQTVDKLERPFGFNWWNDAPVRMATVTSGLPQLKGLRLEPGTAQLIEDVTGIIKTHSSPGDTIFTFPTMPLFYLLSDRWFPTYSGNHNIDVIPDSLSEREATTLLKKRPAVIVFMDMPPINYEIDDILWRGGHPSGLHGIADSIRTLARSYDLAGSFQPYNGSPIRVLVRPAGERPRP